MKRVLIVVVGIHLSQNNLAHLTPLAPVIGTVTAEALSLSEVQVTVTLSDTGGQPVEEYTVSHTGRDSYIVLFDTFNSYCMHICMSVG